MSEDPIVIRLAAAFAEAAAENDFELAERWAQAAWRRTEDESRSTHA